MKLTLKLIGILLVLILALVAIDGLLSVGRERELFLRKMRDNAVLLGETTAPLFKEIWLGQGPQRAFALIQEVNRSEHHIAVRWVSPDTAIDKLFAPRIAPDRIKSALGDSAAVFSFERDGREQMAVYIPVNPKDPTFGWLEMTEAYSDLHAYTRETVIRTLAFSAALVLLAGIMLLVFGTYYLGRPLQRIIEQTKRIGSGDFSRLATPVGQDEIAQLSSSLNDMSSQLAAAQDEVRLQTERRVAAIEQLRHTERLATVGRLASGIAHELGTPLNIISGRAKMIGSGQLTPDESTHSSHVIAEQSDRMAKIIRHLLDFARRRKAERAPVDLCRLCSQTIDLLQPMARKAGVNLQLSAEPDMPLVQLDFAQTQQALVNVIVNGVQAMPDGGNLTITLSQSDLPGTADRPGRSRRCAVITVADEGVGIPPEHLKAIFDPFFTTKEVGAGTGLGLSIAHGIIGDHGGIIDVQSTVGSGTVLTISLPLEE